MRVLLKVEDHLLPESVDPERDGAGGDLLEGDADAFGQRVMLGGEQPHRGGAVLAHVQELHAEVGAELLAVAADLGDVDTGGKVEVEHLHLLIGLQTLQRRQRGDGTRGVGDGRVHERLIEIRPADLHVCAAWIAIRRSWTDRKSTRLNSSHVATSYADFCLSKKKAHTCARHALLRRAI